MVRPDYLIPSTIKRLKSIGATKKYLRSIQADKKYLKLIDADTPYAKKMTVLRNRIFGDVVRPTNKKSMKVVTMLSEEPLYMKDEVINYYPRHRELTALIEVLTHYGLYRDEHAMFKAEMDRLRSKKGIESQKERPRREKSEKSENEKEINELEKIPLKIKVELKNH